MRTHNLHPVSRSLPCLLVLASLATPAHAASRGLSPEQFRSEVTRLQTVVAACAASAAACDPAQVGDDDRVGEMDKEGQGGAGGFEMHWAWLRSALAKARDAKTDEVQPGNRIASMRDAASRLQTLAEQSAAPGNTTNAATSTAQARHEADVILARPEFQAADGLTWWDRFKSRMFSWLDKIFQGVEQVGTKAPWLGRLLEWLLFTSAAVGVVVFVLRSFARQRLRLELGETPTAATAWDREGTDWARLADGFAAEAAWRDAVHCLYWAAIVTLESRRVWRHNPTRTPREYVRLLQPGSPQQVGLRGLTQIFERVWYGLRDAEADEYATARKLYDSLAGGSPSPGFASSHAAPEVPA